MQRPAASGGFASSQSGHTGRGGEVRASLKLIAGLIALIFIAQLVVFFILQMLHPRITVIHSLLDALLATLLISPALYFLTIRPLHANMLRRKQAEQAMLLANQELEGRVERRTADLIQVNQALSAEIAERQRAESRARVQTQAMDAAANGIIITDRDGIIQWCNPAFLRMTGYSSEEIIGQSTRLLKSGVHPPEYYADVWNTILSGKVWHGEMVNRRRGGSEYVEEQTITPVLDEAGAVTHFIAIKQDVSERKLAEDRLEQSNRELQVLSREEVAQRQFAEGLSQAVLALNTSLDLEMVLELILLQIKRVIPYTAAAVLLKDGGSLRLVRHRQLGDSPVVRRAWGEGISINAHPLLQTLDHDHKIIVIPDLTRSEEYPVVQGLEWIRGVVAAPLVSEAELAGMIALISDQPDAFTEAVVSPLEAFIAHAVLAIKNARLFDELRASRKSLQALSRRLVEVQESERRYVAHELHDEAGQALTSLMVGLKLLEQNVDHPQTVLAETAELKHMLEGVMENIHRLAIDLLPTSLEHVGLIAALRQYAQSTSQKHGLLVQFESMGLEERLPAATEVALYRIVQEAMANILRHAHATRADILLERRGDLIVLIVEDDGVGFDPEDALESGRLGVVGMRERAEMLGGSFVIESSIGVGTTVNVEVPYVDSNIAGG